MKESVNKEGNKRGGGRFYRTNLGYLIKNPIYIGKRALKGELYQGEHAAILDGDIFQRAQILMEQNHVTRNALTRDKHEFLLRGLVRCASCGSVILSTFLGVGATAAFTGFLPFGGQEFSILAIIILAASLYVTGKKIADPLVCGINTHL